MAKTAPASAKTPPVVDFEHSLDELEQLVARMEGGELSLDESLASFERGIGLYPPLPAVAATGRTARAPAARSRSPRKRRTV